MKISALYFLRLTGIVNSGLNPWECGWRLGMLWKIFFMLFSKAMAEESISTTSPFMAVLFLLAHCQRVSDLGVLALCRGLIWSPSCSGPGFVSCHQRFGGWLKPRLYLWAPGDWMIDARYLPGYIHLQLASYSCNIVIDKKYIYLVIWMTKTYFSYICGFPPQFLTHSSQNPWKFLSRKSNRSIFCYNIWSLVLSSWNCFRAIKVKWASCYS